MQSESRTNKAHGEALGAEAVKQTKKNLGWPEDKTFYVPEDAAKNWLQAVDRGAKVESDWNALFASYRKAFPEEAAEFERVQEGRLKDGWSRACRGPRGREAVATRTAAHGNECHREIRARVAGRGGGSFDIDEDGDRGQREFPHRSKGDNIYFGVREFGMCAIVNGMAAHGGIIPYGSTFFCFFGLRKPRSAWPR